MSAPTPLVLRQRRHARLLGLAYQVNMATLIGLGAFCFAVHAIDLYARFGR